jgi:FkbM family methyltransferase
MNAFKLRKYQVLSVLPGKIGRRHRRKYLSYGSERHFAAAARDTAGLLSIDLGANVGDYTRQLAATASQVIAFEPDPWSVGQLRANTAALANVVIEEAAASVEDGEIALMRHVGFDDDPTMNSLSTTIVAEKDNMPVEASHRVRQVDFIRYLRELDADIGVLKIDIEGAEVPLLEALFATPELLERIRYIFAETHENKIPGHPARVAALRAFAETCERPQINLFWH